VDGCGCSFQTPTEAKKKNSTKYLFSSGLETSSPAFMNIDGKDVRLKRVKSTEKVYKKPKVGDRFYEVYQAKGLKVRIDYVDTTSRLRDEGRDYNLTITVTKGKQKKVITAKGGCGC
jgi:hypothetical protein